MSLVELIVAFALFGLISSALLGLVLSTAKMVRGSKQRAVAAQLAASVIDETRAQGAIAVTPGRTTSTRSMSGVTFTVVRDAEFVARGASGSSCTSPGVPSFLRVRVAVSWPNMGQVKAPEANTLITPGVGDVDQATGNIAVSVVDRAGAPIADVPVTLSTGTSAAAGPVQRTTADGCAFFAFVAPGTYTAWLGSTGWVDQSGNPNPAVTTSVTASRTASVAMQYDEAASLQLVPVTDAAHPAPADLAYTLYSTLFGNATKTKEIPATGTLPLVATGLFPSTAGYTGWAGTCLDADPGESNRPNAAVTDRGTTGVLNVPVGQFEVVATVGGTPPVGTYQVTANHAADSTCLSGATHSWVGSSSGLTGGALPFGSWTFTVTQGARTATSAPVTFASGAPVTTVSVNVP